MQQESASPPAAVPLRILADTQKPAPSAHPSRPFTGPQPPPSLHAPARCPLPHPSPLRAPACTSLLQGPAVVLSFLVAGLAALLSALCYSEWAVRLPAAGAAHAYLMASFGELAAWMVAATLILQFIMVGAGAGRRRGAACGGSRGLRREQQVLSLGVFRGAAGLLLCCLGFSACSPAKPHTPQRLAPLLPFHLGPSCTLFTLAPQANAAVARSLAPYAGELFNGGPNFAIIEWQGMRVDFLAAGLLCAVSLLLIFSSVSASYFNIGGC